MRKGKQDLIGQPILPSQQAQRGQCRRIALKRLKQYHKGLDILRIIFILQFPPHFEHVFLIDDKYAEIVHDFEGETFIVDGPHDLAADWPAEFVSLLDDTKFPEDLLRPVLDIIRVMVKQRQEHLLDQQLKIFLPNCCIFYDRIDVLHIRIA